MGPDKAASEDAFFVRALPGDRVAAGVVDGMGGMVGGAAAARIGATRIHEALDGADGAGLRPALVTGIERAHEEVLARVAGGGATVAAVSLSREHCQFVHAGDAEGIHLGAAGRSGSEPFPTPRSGTPRRRRPHGERGAGPPRSESRRQRPGGEGDDRPGRQPRAAPSRGHRGAGHGGLTDNVFEEEILEAFRGGSLERGVATLVEARVRMEGPIPGPEGLTIGKPDDLTVLAMRWGR